MSRFMDGVKKVGNALGGLPSQAADAASSKIHGGVIRDKILDYSDQAKTRIGDTGNIRAYGIANKVDGALNKTLNRFTADDMDAIWRDGVSGATAGAISGAAGGAISDDQSVIGGALMGGALGGGAGAGLRGRRAMGSVKDRARVASTESSLDRNQGRLRELRSNKANGGTPDIQTHNLNKAGGMGDGRTYPERIRNHVATNKAVNADISSTQSRVNARQKQLTAAKGKLESNSAPINPWYVGGAAGAGTLAYNTLTANGGLGY